jgi:hypothetical protein
MDALLRVPSGCFEQTTSTAWPNVLVTGSWKGDQSEFFTFQTSLVRNTAFVVWALASAGYTPGVVPRCGASVFLESSWNPSWNLDG